LARLNLKKYYQHRRLNVRYVSFPIPSNISICKDKMALMTWGERPSGVLIHSQQLVASQTAFFKELWEKGKC